MVEKKFPDDFYTYDSEGLKKDIDNAHSYIKESYNQDYRNIVGDVNTDVIDNVFFCGMGGSAISGMLLSDYLEESDLRFESVRGYDLPPYVTKDDLVVITSYSGNTEETLSCYRQARRIGCQILLLSSGGRVEESAEKSRLPYIKLKKGLQPRASLPIMFFTKLRAFEQMGLIPTKTSEVQSLVDYLRQKKLEKMGLKLVDKLVGKTPIIYASEKNYSIAYRWKTQFNENVKKKAFSNRIPEMNHNEILGFTEDNEDYHVIILSFDNDKSRMKKRIGINKELINKRGVEVTELDIKGEQLKSMFTAILVGDYASYFLALIEETDPSPVDMIEDLKEEMGPFI